MKRRTLILCAVLGLSMMAGAQTATVGTEVINTYPYGDPNPVPQFGKIYPYFRYDGFTKKGEARKWTVVTLENRYVRVKILPEVGGKIWSVVDKKTGGELFYDNDAVKFRDIALRGPWTSGGIEFNFGLIGHAPTCAAPVDWKVEQKADGSVSCFIGVLDLLTRTRWTVEVNLPKDKGWFTTRTRWHNSTGAWAPYYCWFNTGVTASDDLHLIFPGNYWVGHDGSTGSWPYDSIHHRDLQYWRNQNFEGSKSFHIAGSQKPFFATYYDDKGYGMMHYAHRDNKLGRKFFTWALSDEGDIWRELLTDKRPQYVELQSGRLYNQNMESSSKTPYKQYLFSPYATDDWTEYWFPYSGTKGADDASTLGVVNMEETGGRLRLMFYALQDVSGELCLTGEDGNKLVSEKVALKVAETLDKTFAVQKASLKRVTLNGHEIWTAESKLLERPHDAQVKVDEQTAYGNYILGRDRMGMCEYAAALSYADKALEKDAHYVPALVLKAALLNHSTDYAEGYRLAQQALSFDQYHPQANYEAGCAALQLGKVYDALDRFELCALTYDMRSAACLQLARIYFSRLGDDVTAEDYARRSLKANADNLSACELLYLIYNKEGRTQEAAAMLERVRSVDALSHFADYEDYRAGRLEKAAFLDRIKEEMKAQELLEQAVRYHGLGLDDRAVDVLSLNPQPNVLTQLWLAYLKADATMLPQALTQPLDYVFPFRSETRPVLDWALRQHDCWQWRYLSALLLCSRQKQQEARSLVASVDAPRYAPFYAFRAQLFAGTDSARSDLQTACHLDGSQWRYVEQLADCLSSKGDLSSALKVLERYYNKHRDNFHIGSSYVKALIDNGQYARADKVLATLDVLPFEGYSGGHNLLRQVKLMEAFGALKAGRAAEAAQRVREQQVWPHNLGSGKPYDELIDYRFDNYLLAVASARQKADGEAEDYLRKVAADAHTATSAQALFQVLACRQLGQTDKAAQLLESWTKAQSNPTVKEWGRAFVTAHGNQRYAFDYDAMTCIFKSTMGMRDARLF